MWLAFYNSNIGDVLLLTRSARISDDFVETESSADVTLVKDRRSDEVVSINIFNVIDDLNIEEEGQVSLSEDDQALINERIEKAGFDIEVSLDDEVKFVVGYVEEVIPHEDSDHLSITQTQVGPDESLQIVCGASNIDEDQYVIVAKPGAMMPNGAIIWPGELRGEESHGMICSSRELNLTDIEDMPGIWELDKAFEPGTPLDEVVAYYQNAK